MPVRIQTTASGKDVTRSANLRPLLIIQSPIIAPNHAPSIDNDATHEASCCVTEKADLRQMAIRLRTTGTNVVQQGGSVIALSLMQREASCSLHCLVCRPIKPLNAHRPIDILDMGAFDRSIFLTRFKVLCEDLSVRCLPNNGGSRALDASWILLFVRLIRFHFGSLDTCIIRCAALCERKPAY